ncbi:hypothetical protein N7466_007210 [Penicillium verhagenii]|uniref:uncharacterized protein n=1 Tax=Penicillium verhagenii TaxID=1562060 RepID=UPI002544E458|nr:uncharacterized protein N7466_007210 [Penicillium verhagenii]KAJ5928254.1 hypothetical protein N7466_007210 [Penicillium verhagenii]
MNSIPMPEPTPTIPASDPNNQAKELAEDEFYHHPVWSEREAMCRSDAHRFITQNAWPCSYPWGFIIYRTVYTTESERLWPLAMEKLAYALKVGNQDRQGRPEQLIQASHKDAILSDMARWDGASIEHVRNHFAEYLRKTDQMAYPRDQRYALCLVIDEKALKSITAPGDEVGWVGAVDARFDPAIKYDWPGYCGFMRVKVRSLWDIYLNLHFDQMWNLCPEVPEGWIPVYDGGSRVGQDESGEIERDISQQRPAGVKPALGRGRGLPTF